jgi:hypothetical protein
MAVPFICPLVILLMVTAAIVGDNPGWIALEVVGPQTLYIREHYPGDVARENRALPVFGLRESLIFSQLTRVAPPL